MSEKQRRIAKLKGELFNKKTQMQEFVNLVYVHGYIPSTKHISKFKLWQEDVDLIEAELNLVTFGCSLSFKGFNWLDIFNYRQLKLEERTCDYGNIVEELVNTPGRLGKEVKHVYNTYDECIGGFEFLTACGS